ncbi:NACHT domain-containing protein [Thermosporothrix hazakensis]|uniref:NACHT domain-containing protein n=1 Tax=Thermosporothrix hazakensis TaxID=644383 RepID=A0A326UB63_THEHA|nr:winged helix-turn-helix domain-containing protein [Thermosporothrix hazakensis]PZW32918.1 NACHT domain-containing protein [Thermosporothrix hazakensis]GCE48950.1 hypothetical protein KTH_38190 [Thermosporothrix hazakensis]
MSIHSDRRILFRHQDIRYVMHALKLKKSCALIGADGAGKTSFLRRLLSQEVQEQFLADQQEAFLFLFLNTYELEQSSALAYYQRMALLLEPSYRQLGPSLPEGNVLLLENETIARHLLFERVEAILQAKPDLTIVFLIDAFDAAFVEVKPHFLRVLRALREEAQRRVCYVVSCSNLPALICQTPEGKVVKESFLELFNGHVRGLKGLEHTDIQLLLRDVQQEYHFFCSPEIEQLLIEVTGGYHNLLRMALATQAERTVRLHERDSITVCAEKLIRDSGVLSACEQLWNSLSDIEQHMLFQMQKGLLSRNALVELFPVRQVNDALNSLLLKGILIETNRSKVYRCFAPLFVAFVLLQLSTQTHGLQLDMMRRQVWIDGKLHPVRLTVKEFTLLTYLAQHAGEICSRAETTKAVYGEEYDPLRDDARLDALVERTRHCIGDRSRSPRFLETVRGIGHRLNGYGGERR